MISKYIGRLAAAVIVGACVTSSHAQITAARATVPIHYEGLFDSSGGTANITLDTTVGAFGSGNGTDIETLVGLARLAPGRAYTFTAQLSLVTKLAVKINAPSGFRVFIDGIERETYVLYNNGANLPTTTFTVRLDDGSSAEVGAVPSIRPGQILWSVGLGQLRNGKSAGLLRIAESAPTVQGIPVNAYRAAGLYYDRDNTTTNGASSTDDGVYVLKQSGVLRQVYTATVLADIVPDGDHAYYIRLYGRNSGQISTTPDASGVYTVSGTPLFEYHIENPTYPANTGLRVTETINQGTPLVRWTEMLQQSGQPSGTTQWLVQDWTKKPAGASSVTSDVRHRWTFGDSDRYEIYEVLNGAGTVAYRALREYFDYQFSQNFISRELYSETLGIAGDVWTHYFYHINSNLGSWTKVKSIVRSDGSWTAMDYSGDFRSRGKIVQVRRPYKDGPASDPGFDATVGEVTNYTYDFEDNFGSKVLPTKIETKVNNVVTARSEFSYAYETITDVSSTYQDSAHAVMPIRVQTRKDYYASGASDYLTTVTRVYREDADPEYHFFPGLVHSVIKPDQSATAMVYFRSNFFGLSAPFVPSTSGESRVQVAIQGTVDTNLGAAYPSYGSTQPLPTGFRLVSGKSSMSRTLLSSAGLVGISDKQAYVSNTWQTIQQDFVQYTNSVWPSLTQRRSSDSSAFWDVSASTWSGGQLQQTTDETGVTQSLTYDDVGRVQTTTRASAVSGAATIPAQTVTKTYDAAGRMLTETTSGSGETLTLTMVYDTNGRVLSETKPGQSATTFTYNEAARTTTTTLPTSKTRIETRYLDGKAASITGSAVVAQFFDYSVDSVGQRYRKVNLVSTASPRKIETWTDWLDRVTATKRPGFTGQPDVAESTSYHPSKGWLERTSRTGYADQVAVYNGMGEMVRSGVDLGTAGLDLASSDRITDSDVSFESYDGALWRTTQKWVYPTVNNGTRVLTGVVRERITGLSTSLRAETRSSDADGAETRVTVTVDAVGKVVTTTTAAPGMVSTATEVKLNGFVVSSTGFDGLTTQSNYDALGRIASVIAPRTGAITTTYWANTTLPKETKDALNLRLSYTEYDAAARPILAKDAHDKTTRTDYNDHGKVLHQWGSATSPVAFSYNSYDERVGLSTYRDTGVTWEQPTWPGAGATPSNTSWEFDEPSGLLRKKTDHSGQFVEYTYNDRGQTYQRFWARTVNGQRVACTYGYYAGTGELASITYNDSTPPVSYGTYTRTGQPTTVTDYSGQRSFEYGASKFWQLAKEYLPSFFGSRVITNLYATGTSSNTGDASFTGHTIATAAGQNLGYQLGTVGTPANDFELDYATSNIGRVAGMQSKRSNNTISQQFVYGYQSNSALLKSLSVVNDSFNVDRSFETSRDLLANIETRSSTTVRTKFAYTYNDLRQRDTVVQSGDVYNDYGDSIHELFEYDDRGELKTAATYLGATGQTSPLSGRRHEFDYDAAGNRKWSNTSGVSAVRDDYAVNDLNQYTSRENNTVAVSGTAATNAKVAVTSTASALAGRAGRHWGDNALVDNAGKPFRGSVPVYSGIVGGGANGKDLFRTENKTLFLPAVAQSFSYDPDGNLIGDGVWTYDYDAENRLIRMTPTSLAIAGGVPNQILEFRYDYLHRRIQKKIIDGVSLTPVSERRFIYDGWNLVAELDGGAAIKRSFTWGLDLVGSLTTSGGIGALHQIYDYDLNKTLFAAYDGNGNVAALLNAGTGTVEATYEYSPFGELIRATGSYAQANPFRFSTKWQDAETGLVYYGHRYYNPHDGRFINRDPVGEDGGLNLYGFCGNDSVGRWDYLGNTSPTGMVEPWRQEWLLNSGPSYPLQLPLPDFTDAIVAHRIDQRLQEVEKQLKDGKTVTLDLGAGRAVQMTLSGTTLTKVFSHSIYWSSPDNSYRDTETGKVESRERIGSNRTASETTGSAVGGVIALQVKEGSFALKMRPISLRGQGAGMDAFIVFLPGKNGPDSKAIRMIQVAKMTDPDDRPVTWSGGEAERMRAMTKAGFFVDIIYAKGTSSPYYDDFARGRIGSKAGDDTQSAAISDRPFMAVGRGAFIAETAVVDVETGHYYGSVRWGFTAANDTATLMQPVARDIPSQDLLGALARFNWLYRKK